MFDYSACFVQVSEVLYFLLLLSRHPCRDSQLFKSQELSFLHPFLLQSYIAYEPLIYSIFLRSYICR